MYNYSGFAGKTISIHLSEPMAIAVPNPAYNPDEGNPIEAEPETIEQVFCAGATVAVITPEGTIHPDYVGHRFTQKWIEDVPDWEAVIQALPIDEPAPDSPNWEGFYNALIVSIPYQYVRVLAASDITTNLLYSDLGLNLANAIAGKPNPDGFQFTYNQLKTQITNAGSPFSEAHLAALQLLIDTYSIPLTL